MRRKSEIHLLLKATQMELLGLKPLIARKDAITFCTCMIGLEVESPIDTECLDF